MMCSQSCYWNSSVHHACDRLWETGAGGQDDTREAAGGESATAERRVSTGWKHIWTGKLENQGQVKPLGQGGSRVAGANRAHWSKIVS